MERDGIEKLCSAIEDAILRNRIQGCMEWYLKKAVYYRRIFYILSIMTIAMPLLTTMTNSLEGISDAVAKNMVSGFSMMAALAASALCLFKCQEKWTLYRTTLERMKKILSLYCAGKFGDDGVNYLISELEECMDAEHSKWEGLQQQGDNPEDKGESGETKEKSREGHDQNGQSDEGNSSAIKQ